MQRTTTYREQSRVFLAQAYEELAKGDLQQASEKGWGAASQMVKAVAQERGWLHSSHRHLYEVINALESETSDSELTVLFASAGDLHINFYENRYSSNNIRHLLNQVERFVDKAEGLLGTTAKRGDGTISSVDVEAASLSPFSVNSYNLPHFQGRSIDLVSTERA